MLSGEENDEDDASVELLTTSVNPSVPIRIAMYIHMGNVIWCMAVLFLGSIPYYYYLGPEISKIGLVASSISFTIFYVLMSLAVAHKRILTGVFCGVIWTLSAAALAGFLSAMIFNVTPLQFVAIAFGQSISVVIYLQLAAKTETSGIEWTRAIPGLLTASIAIWLVSLYGFVIEGDWFYAVGLAVLVLILVGYNAWQLSQVRRYSMTESEIERAIMEYYCGVAVDVIKRL